MVGGIDSVGGAALAHGYCRSALQAESVLPAPQGHAGIAVAIGPTGIATVSGWGLAVMTLLVLRAGTIILRRAMRRPQGAALHSLQW